MLPLPAPLELLCFRVRFRFLTIGNFCFRFQLLYKTFASEFASASNLFHQSNFRFHKKLTASASTSLFSMKQLIVSSVKKQASLLCKLFYLTCVVDWAWYGMEDDFSMFHNGNFLSFHFHSSLKIFHSMFHSILKFPSVFHSIVPYQRNFILKAMQRILYCFASL